MIPMFSVSSRNKDTEMFMTVNQRVAGSSHVAIPRGATPAQVQQLEKAIELAKNKNVEILIHVVQ